VNIIWQFSHKTILFRSIINPKIINLIELNNSLIRKLNLNLNKILTKRNLANIFSLKKYNDPRNININNQWNKKYDSLLTLVFFSMKNLHRKCKIRINLYLLVNFKKTLKIKSNLTRLLISYTCQYRPLLHLLIK